MPSRQNPSCSSDFLRCVWFYSMTKVAVALAQRLTLVDWIESRSLSINIINKEQGPNLISNMARGHDCVVGTHFIYRRSQLIANDFFWISPSLLVFPRIFLGNLLVILVHGDIIKKTFCNWGGRVRNLRGDGVDSSPLVPLIFRPSFWKLVVLGGGWVGVLCIACLPFFFWPLSRITSVVLRL